MRFRNLFPLLVVCLLACKNKNQDAVIQGKTFDKAKWAVKNNDSYPYRNEMLNDFIANYKIHGLKKDSLLSLLGQPDRSENGHLYYMIAQERLWLITLHTKTLVIKLTKDSTVEWRKIHE
jgi:hypothetical protein